MRAGSLGMRARGTDDGVRGGGRGRRGTEEELRLKDG
jgi:hypothetical protein